MIVSFALLRHTVHGSTGSPRTVEIIQLKNLSVRPELRRRAPNKFLHSPSRRDARRTALKRVALRITPYSLLPIQPVDKPLLVQFLDHLGLHELRGIRLARIRAFGPVENRLNPFHARIGFFGEQFHVEVVSLLQLVAALHFHVLFQDRRSFDFFGLVEVNALDHRLHHHFRGERFGVKKLPAGGQRRIGQFRLFHGRQIFKESVTGFARGKGERRRQSGRVHLA